MDSKIKIFCDFDGTITQLDLGDEIFKQFGQFEPFHTQLINGEINIKQYWHSIVPTLRNDIEPEIINLAHNSYIDNYFIEFLNMCSSKNYEIYIVSDGFSSYIKPIFQKLGFDNLKVFCNSIDFSGNLPFPKFYGASESCNCLSSSCKRNVILNNTLDEDISVFIGDGYSDFCAAEHSDIIFAKKNLARYCSNNRIPFFNFKTFFDINKIFDNLHSGKIKFRKRRQAQLKSKNAFEQE
jgi:2,3-diketo-5-methylthio-1-phosphopentane phosphatase